jgi:hypothetical protein
MYAPATQPEVALAYQPRNEDYLPEWAAILFKAAWYAREKGSDEVAERMGLQSLKAREEALGGEHPDTLNMANLAATYGNQGR